MSQRHSNYEITKKRMRPEFLKYDQRAMVEKHGLQSGAEFIFVPFFGREYRVDRCSGAVLLGDDEADYNVTMTIYDLLCYAKPGCTPGGELVSMHSLSALHSGSPALGGGMFDSVARSFDGRAAELAAACVRLGGTAWGRGDAAYRMPMFGGLDVGIQFWNADEEFPPSLTVFVDRNLMQYMHFETMWYAVSHLLERLREELDG